MKLHFLGTGTSFGIPVVGCRCGVCTSGDERDSRTRHAALIVTDDGANILVDTPPELRIQLLRACVRSIDAVWYTHDHADHTHGIDDLRVFSSRRGQVPAYADRVAAELLMRKFDYIFDSRYQPHEGTTKPEMSMTVVSHFAPVKIAGLEMLPLPVPHGDTTSLGFRAGDLGYITDGKRLTAEVVEGLRGVRVLVLNALWFGNPHPTHFNVEEAIDASRDVGAETTYLTHLTHRVSHHELLERLPAGVLPAHDGLTIDI